MEKHLRPPLMHVAKIRIKQIAAESINAAIQERIASQTDHERLIQWQKDNDGKISFFMLNYAEHMKIAAETKEVVTKTLESLTHVPEHIPLGQALDSAIIASFGPRVPVRFVPQGAAKIDLQTRQTDAGINMLLVEAYIRITVEVTIIIPFDTESEIVQTEVPISYLLVVGDVPMYYFDNKGNPVRSANGSEAFLPSITLPDITSLPTSGAEGNVQDGKE
jgi:sporulation protein YunB